MESLDDSSNSVTITIMIVIMLIGIFGNIMNLIVFSQKTMRKISTFHFLIYLSLIDLLVLIICSSNALFTNGFDIEIRTYSNWMCRLHAFLTSLLRHMSSFILMLVNIERVYVVFGNKINFCFKCLNINSSLSRNIFSKNRIEKIMILISVGLALINIHVFMYFNLISFDSLDNPYASNKNLVLNRSAILRNYSNNLPIHSNDENMKACLPMEGIFYYYFYIHIWVWVDIVIYSLIPFFIMVTCSILILVQIRKESQKFLTNLSRSTQSNRELSAKRNRKNKQMAIILIMENIYFLSCSLPYFYTSTNFSFLNHDDLSKTTVFRYHILSYSVNCFNFIFYGLFSEKYRHVLKNLIFYKVMRKQNKMKRNQNQIVRKKVIKISSYHNTIGSYSNKLEISEDDIYESERNNHDLIENISDEVIKPSIYQTMDQISHL